MLEKWKMFFRITQGYRLMYLAAMFVIVFAALFHFVTPLIVRFTIDNVVGNQIPDNQWLRDMYQWLGGREFLLRNLYLMGILLVSIAMLEGIFQYAKGKWSAISSEGMAKKIRENLYEHIQYLPYSEHIKAETGDWIQRCISDVETVRRFFAAQLIEVGRASLMLALVLPLMLKLNVKMTLYAMIAVPLIFASAVIFFIKIKKSFQLSDEAEGALSSVLQENLTGVRVVRAFARENYEIEKFDKVNKDFRDKTYHLIKLLAYYWSISDLVCFIQIAGVIVAGTVLAQRGDISVGTIVVFLSYETAVLFPIRQMGRVLTDMGKASVSWGRIYEILSKKSEKDLPSGMCTSIKGDIEFQNVSMSYEDEKPVLKNLNLSVKAGQTVAFMGPSGSGKSSLIKLLLRLYEYEGSVMLDGYELSQIDRHWVREHIASVLQEPFLYSKSIKENIRIACPDSEEEWIEKSARTAGIHEVIDGFDKGYDTLLGEKGVNLSGGQKQRVAIARALIRNTPVLIFDDSLSAVDTETENYILGELRKLAGKITIIIIAHRITSVMNADQIFVLNHGEIIQNGNHDELIAQDGMYQRIWKLQSDLEESLSDELEENDEETIAV
jgi:ATP-binding cassette subfamily B protein